MPIFIIYSYQNRNLVKKSFRHDKISEDEQKPYNHLLVTVSTGAQRQDSAAGEKGKCGVAGMRIFKGM
jgi:hypothetical protein